LPNYFQLPIVQRQSYRDETAGRKVQHEQNPWFLVLNRPKLHEEHIFRLLPHCNRPWKWKIVKLKKIVWKVGDSYVNALQLQVWIAAITSSRVDWVLIGDNFPKLWKIFKSWKFLWKFVKNPIYLRADLISALSGLNMNDFTHLLRFLLLLMA
jgi:hypothetical protein